LGQIALEPKALAFPKVVNHTSQTQPKKEKTMIPLNRYFQIGLFLTATTLAARAGSFFSDFNSGALPPGTHTNAAPAGGAYLELSGGVGDSGCFKICKTVNSQNGSLILDDLDAGNPIYGFDITFNVRVGGSSNPADGFALCVAPDFTDTSIWGETGAGSGIRFTWGTYTGSGQSPPDPAIRVRVGPSGNIVAYNGYSVAGMSTGGSDPSTWWSTCHIHLNPDGSLNFDYKGANVLTNFFVPGYQDFINAGLPVRFGIAGRTGGLNDNFWIDNLSITTFTNPMVGISQQPFSQTVQQGDDVDFDVRLGNTNGVTYQWYSNNVAIAGATGQTLTLTNVQAGASGSKYKVTATGPNNAVTSTEVTLTVTNLTLPSTPQLSFNFNDGLVPSNTTVSGTAAVDSSGGVNNSGCLKITTAANGQSGAFIVNDPNSGAPVYGFTARFQSLLGGGTVPPADGFAFAFGSDIPASPSGNFMEGAGLGTGLVVSFDIYNNDFPFLNLANGANVFNEAQPAPSIDVRFGGQVIATRQLPVSFMETGLNPDGTPAFKDTIIQLNTDGTINVVYHGDLVFDHLSIPGFGSISGGQFALAGQTGGLNENIWFDNIQLTSVLTSGAVRVTQPPANQTILVNHAMTNSVAVNDPTGVTYQWYRGSSAIGGATAATYVIPSVVVGDNGAVFTVQATKSSVTVTSAPATLTVLNLTAPSSPQFTYNFNDGLVPVATANIYGNASVTANGGVGDSGVLHLTDNINGQNSAFVVSNLVFGGNLVSAISVSFDVREGGGSGSPADGFSFNWATGLPDGTVANAETGTGNGVSLCFRRYVGNGNADNPPSPYIGIKYKGTFIATTQIPGSQLDTDVSGTPAFRTMLFRVDSDGKAYLAYGERVLYNGLQLPGYTFIPNSKFGLYGRTGGENNNQWFDNINIQATQGSQPMAVVTQPANTLVIAGQTATFSVVVNNPAGATYQWQKNGGNISGATQSSYTTPATTLADNGALFRVTGSGASGSATSSNAVLTVVAPITVSNPIKIYNFDDCLQPPDTILNGVTPSSGYIACSGGVGDSGVLHITDNVNSLQAAFLMPDFNSNAPVKALAVSMAVRIADGSGTPADGISFCWGSSNSIPDNANFGEGGQGDGLIVSLITYAGRSDGPSFNVSYKGNRLVNMIVPYSALFTGDLGTDPTNQYATLVFRVNENGTFDMQYKGNAIFNALPLPGYTAMIGGRFGIGGRTGGENESQWFDNIQIATTPGLLPGSIGFSVSGGNLRLTWNAVGLKLQSSPKVAPTTWTDVPGGATSPYVAPLTGAGLFYRLAPAL
jgi:hypothetical protein